MKKNPVIVFTAWFVVILVSVWVLAFLLDRCSTTKEIDTTPYWKNLDSSKEPHLIKQMNYSTGEVTYYGPEDNVDEWEYKGKPSNGRHPSTKTRVWKERLSPLEKERLDMQYPNGYEIRISSGSNNRDLQDIIIDSDVDLNELIEYTHD